VTEYACIRQDESRCIDYRDGKCINPEGCRHKREIVLNGERIRKMSDEQLAYFLRSITDCDICPVEKCLESSCAESILHWLKQPVKEECHETD